jgi:hypothetical protein
MSIARLSDSVTPLRIPTYFACHPLRSPSWKWERAIGIANNTQPRTSRRFDGDDAFGWIKKATKFYQGLQAVNKLSALTRLEEKFRSIFWAHNLFEAANDQHAMVDALILARVSPQTIAKTANLSSETVEAYEELFFDVRRFLDKELYILNAVFGNNLQSLRPDSDYATIWKTYAYYTGPHVLRLLISKFSPGSWCDDQDQVSNVIQDDIISSMRLKTSIAAKTIPVNSRTQIALLNAFIKFVEVERNSDSQEAATKVLLSGVEEMYSSMRINIGGRDPGAGYTAIDTGLVGIYDKGGVELRYDELMDVANGIIPAEIKPEAEFPPPSEN